MGRRPAYFAPRSLALSKQEVGVTDLLNSCRRKRKPASTSAGCQHVFYVSAAKVHTHFTIDVRFRVKIYSALFYGIIRINKLFSCMYLIDLHKGTVQREFNFVF